MILCRILIITLFFGWSSDHRPDPVFHSGLDPDSESSSDSYLLYVTDRTIFSQFGAAVQQGTTAGERSWSSLLRVAGWILLGSALLILPFYVLFQVRKKQQQNKRLQVLQSQFNQLFHKAPCGYHSVDDDGVFIDVNQTLADWLGYEREELVGHMKFTEVIEEHAAAALSAMAQGGGKSKISLNLIRKNSTRFPVVIQVLDGEYPNRLFGTTDNSECHEALERIKSLDQELESFSYSISHDLRAPLRSIDGYSKILQEDFAGQLGSEGNRVLNVIVNNARRMGNLIDDLLEFGRLGRKDLQLSHVDMTAMARGIADDLLRESAPDRKVDVRIENLRTAFADPEMIRQVWFNLLDNAFKYSGKTPEAVIEVRSFQTKEDEWCYEVRDNGVGFDMKYVPKLFGVFQRLHKIQDFTGTGVGLAIVKRIISRHGGRVWAEGSPESGAVFYFTIPTNENT